MVFVIAALESEDIGCPLFLQTDKILFSRKDGSDELDRIPFWMFLSAVSYYVYNVIGACSFGC